MKTRAPCRHCHQRIANRSRGLCLPCFDDEEVRVLYPSAAPWATGLAGYREKRIRPAARPTRARPGSEEKMAVMAARVQANQEIFHPEDLRLEEFES